MAGGIGKALLVLFTVFWTYWSIGEMYHEGWWGAWYNRLPYLVPAVVCLSLTLVALTWHRVGGWALIALGSLFSLWWWGVDLVRGQLTLRRFLGQFPFSGTLVLIGVLFLVEARYRRRRPVGRSQPWWRRNLWYLLALGPPLVILVGFSAAMLPVVLTRQDDGDRGARVIEGEGVALVWAPQGPGWNWRQPWGGYPSWQSVALYGLPPVGLGDKPGYDGRADGRYATEAEMARYNLCRYLHADGQTLADTPQDVWRMPTTEELVRSLVRDGESAGCSWSGGELAQAPCEVRPDKETPLWAPDAPAIYYWAFEAYDDGRAYFVSYNGFVNATSKTGGNPRHSYRCVREP